MNLHRQISMWFLLAATELIALFPGILGAQINENIQSTRNPIKASFSCTTACHQIHGGTSKLLKEAANDLCMSCHDPTIGADPTAIKVLTHLNQSSNSKIQHKEQCLDCHNPHYDLVNRRGRLGRLPEDPPAEGVCQDGNSSNNDICRNFKLLGNFRDDVNGAKSSYMPAAFLRYPNDDAKRNPTPLLTQSGLGNFALDIAANLNESDLAWETDTASSGAWLQANFRPVAAATTYPYGDKEILEVRLYTTEPNPPTGLVYSGVYDVEYSDNGTTWSTAFSGFAPTLLGLNKAQWAQGVGAHQYWRLRLTNTPGTGPWISEVMFYAASDCTTTGGTAIFDTNVSSPTYNFYQACTRPVVAGRVDPIAVGGVDYNDWVSTSAPFQGVCNTCHTRTQHHRNNDITNANDYYYSGPDHTHNDNRNCTDCHDHYANGFSKNQ